jgi:hypothetical protein
MSWSIPSDICTIQMTELEIEEAGKSSILDWCMVPGAWADGSSWSHVIERLQLHGYRVTAPQFPTTGRTKDFGRSGSLRSCPLRLLLLV